MPGSSSLWPAICEEAVLREFECVKRSAPHFFSWPLTVMQATNTHCTVTVGVNRTIITNNFQNVVFIFKQTGTANKLIMYN